MNKIYSFSLLFLILFSSQSAFAACTSPAGAASQTRYDFGLNKLYYCNDTDWIESGGSGSTSPVELFNASVTGTTVTVPGVVSSPSHYVFLADTNSSCQVNILINGVFRASSTYGNKIVDVVTLSAPNKTVIYPTPTGSGSSAYSGLWNGDMKYTCASTNVRVIRLN